MAKVPFMNAHTVMAMLNDAGVAVGIGHYQEPIDKFTAGIEGLLSNLGVSEASAQATNVVPNASRSDLQIG